VNTDRLLEKAKHAKRSSKYVALCDAVDLRDVVALANTGGGVIVARRSPDAAAIRDRLRFDDIELHGAALVVGPAVDAPLALEPDGPYFRHGARSVPATHDDLKRFMDRRVRQVRKRMLVDIARVIRAPDSSEVVAIERTEDEHGEQVIRITSDENAPLFRAVDFDVTHPFRQKELIAEVNARLPADRAINAYEFQAIRRTNDVDPDFVHRPRFGTNQYSRAFADWLVERLAADAELVPRARAEYQLIRRRRRA
jgi:hypothetical protein